MSYSIIIDTNIVFNDFFFQSADMKKLLRIANHEPITLCMTQFNYGEILKKYQDEIRPILKTLKSTKRDIEKHKIQGLVNFDNTKANHHVAKYKAFLDSLIEEYDFHMIEHPTSVDVVERIANRYFQRIKPFDENKLSFQDAIIWESIVDYVDSEFLDKVVFISSNHKDFGDKEKGDLHADLKKDIDEYTDFSYYQTVSDFLTNEKAELNEYINEYFTENVPYDEASLAQDLLNHLERTNYLESTVDSVLTNGQFDGEYFEGWGADGSIDKSDLTINEVSLDIEAETWLISFDIHLHIHFNIQTTDPTYERGDDGDGLLSEASEGLLYIHSNVTYSPDKDEFIDYVELESELLRFGWA